MIGEQILVIQINQVVSKDAIMMHRDACMRPFVFLSKITAAVYRGVCIQLQCY